MSPRDKALHTLGRMVVNIQHLEQVLKTLSHYGPVQGTLESIPAFRSKKRSQLDAAALGKAIQAWCDVLDGRVTAPAQHDDLFDITVREKFEFNIPAEHLDAHVEGLKAILKERNFIIHGGLARFPWGSDDDCVELTDYLENINGAIGEQLEFLKPIATELKRLRA